MVFLSSPKSFLARHSYFPCVDPVILVMVRVWRLLFFRRWAICRIAASTCSSVRFLCTATLITFLVASINSPFLQTHPVRMRALLGMASTGNLPLHTNMRLGQTHSPPLSGGKARPCRCKEEFGAYW